MGQLSQLLHRGFEVEDMKNLAAAYDWISGLADRSCDCHWNQEASQRDNPCDACQARAARDALDLVLDPKPVSLHPERLTNAAERIYYEKWCEDNKRSPGINGGFTLIEHLLSTKPYKRDALTARNIPPPVSQHDMSIATTIIQWLGTSCGSSFIQSCEREIAKRRDERVKFLTDGTGHTPKSWKERTEHGEIFQVADSIAATFISQTKNTSVYGCLRQAIINAICEFQNRASVNTTDAQSGGGGT